MAKTPMFGKSPVMGSIILAAGAGALGFVADTIMEAIAARGVKKKSREYYIKMLEQHPQLKKENPVMVARYWESLMHFAPYMAQDPMAAGAYIRQSMQRGYQDDFGGPPPDTFATLTNINKNLRENRMRSEIGATLAKQMLDSKNKAEKNTNS